MSDERRCGACTECCRTLAIPTLGKPADKLCEHARSCGGCGIYDARPSECRTFQCQWLMSPEIFRRRDRPDRLGVMFDLVEHERYGRCVMVHETRPGALLDGRVRALAERFGGQQLVLGVRRGEVRGPGESGPGFGLIMAGPADKLALLRHDLIRSRAGFKQVKPHG